MAKIIFLQKKKTLTLNCDYLQIKYFNAFSINKAFYGCIIFYISIIFYLMII